MDEFEEVLQRKLKLVMKHFPGDNIYHWTVNKSKIKIDGSHGGKWIKGKLVSVDGSMVGVDLGTRIVKVNISKMRKDHKWIGDVEIRFDPTGLASADSTAKTASTSVSKTTCSTEDCANTIMRHDSAWIGSEGSQCGNYAWEPVTNGRIGSYA